MPEPKAEKMFAAFSDDYCKGLALDEGAVELA